MLADVEALDFFFRRNADADRLLEEEPDQPGRHEHECADRDDAEQLHAQELQAAAVKQAVCRRERGDALFSEEPDADRAEHAAAEMYGGRADGIIDPDPVEEHDREHDQNARERADEERSLDGNVGAAARDGHKAGEAAVDGHAEIRLAHRDPRSHRRGEHRGDGRGIRRHQNIHDVGRVLKAHCGAGVEAEPAEPQDEQADDGQRHVVAGYRLGLAVLAVFPDARAEDPCAREGRPAAHGVHDGVAGKVHEAEVGEPAAAPYPVADNRVDHEGEDKREDDERNVLHALRHGAGNDRGRRAAEDELEEELAPERDRRRERVIVERIVGAAENKQVLRADEWVVPAEHDAPAEQQKAQRGNGKNNEVFGKNIDGILRSGKAGLHACEAEVHEKDQDGGQKYP